MPPRSFRPHSLSPTALLVGLLASGCEPPEDFESDAGTAGDETGDETGAETGADESGLAVRSAGAAQRLCRPTQIWARPGDAPPAGEVAVSRPPPCPPSKP